MCLKILLNENNGTDLFIKFLIYGSVLNFFKNVNEFKEMQIQNILDCNIFVGYIIIPFTPVLYRLVIDIVQCTVH